jgi:hypothetical protein
MMSFGAIAPKGPAPGRLSAGGATLKPSTVALRVWVLPAHRVSGPAGGPFPRQLRALAKPVPWGGVLLLATASSQAGGAVKAWAAPGSKPGSVGSKGLVKCQSWWRAARGMRTRAVEVVAASLPRVAAGE